ncbi:hypothetical protein BH20VER1_BH20VER1_28360 [soil metagenome]
MVEALPRVSEPIMEQHEDAGLIAFIAMSILGVVSLAGFAIFRQPRLMPSWYGFFCGGRGERPHGVDCKPRRSDSAQ